MSQTVAERIAAEFGDMVYGTSRHEFTGQWRVDVKRDAVLPVLRFCHDTLGLHYLADVTAVDNLQMPAPREQRFEVIYVLENFEARDDLVLRAMVPEDDPVVESATAIWKAANWLEREVYDMFGISFRNHPNLIRILLPENFDAHPLRKDFPTEGIGYRDRFPIISREDA